MDVRGRRLRKRSDPVTAFTSSMAFDGRIAPQVVKTNMAHMVSLVRSGEVDPETGGACLAFLLKAPTKVPAGAVAEDYHQFLEQKAVDALGVAVAGYLNLGKSRNDQVATAVRMELRDSILSLGGAVLSLQEALLGVARRDGSAMMPGYTHLQRAQPVTVAHHFFAHFDAFQSVFQRLMDLYARVNVSPMGSAALGGTSVNVDRREVASLLGFEGLTANAMDAVSSRDVLLESLSCATLTMIDASRLAEELILWSSTEFGFAELSDEYAASSSIMPQKKNPVVPETVRAKCGSVLGSFTAACAIAKALPYSYNLDLQETTPHLWRGMDDAAQSVSMLAGCVASMKLNRSAMARAVRSDYSTATALANHLVKEEGISFRQAHAVVGELVAISAREGTPFAESVAKRMGQVSSRLGKRMTITRDEAARVLDPEQFLSMVRTEGGANPRFAAGEARRRAKAAASEGDALAALDAATRASEKRLGKAALGISREVKR